MILKKNRLSLITPVILLSALLSGCDKTESQASTGTESQASDNPILDNEDPYIGHIYRPLEGSIIDPAGQQLTGSNSYSGHVDIDDMDGVKVMLTFNDSLRTTTPDANGYFKFDSLPDGEYALKARKEGYKSAPAQRFTLSENSPAVDSPVSLFTLEPLNHEDFSFHWQEDQSTAGYDYSSYINRPVSITFLDKDVNVIDDDSSANKLNHDYNILLVDSDTAAWTQEHSYRLLEIMKSIPQDKWSEITKTRPSVTKWQLTSEHIEDDIQVTRRDDETAVVISEDAFVNASHRIAKINGKRGIFYSKRLHHALVRYVTDNGKNIDAYEKILNDRFGISIELPAEQYTTLTQDTTGGESAERFQKFQPEEIVLIINMFEEMPKGMHKLPEFKYLLRRKNGTPHPVHPSAAAVAWPGVGYIEFMEAAFKSSNVEHVHRLLIHEKSHILWAKQFDEQLKLDWIELAGWYNDASSDSGWSTTKQTEFVSPYAHLKNPNEDMAESISYFIINPDKLKSRAIEKYNFIRDRIMQGNIYLSKIRNDLTFKVFNLYPDYVFPGKIKQVDINVQGDDYENKTVTVEIKLHALDVDKEGAKRASLRVFSEVDTFTDVVLYPVNKDSNEIDGSILSTTLRGTFTLSKYAKSGLWHTPQITITDAVGNQRMEGANDFGWKLAITNPLEDYTAPQYVAETTVLTKSTREIEGKPVQIIQASWEVDEAVGLSANQSCFAALNDTLIETYSIEKYGNYNINSQTCSVDFIMPDYMASSDYSLDYIKMTDLALNQQGVYFTDPGKRLRRNDKIAEDEKPEVINLVTSNPDVETPELDLNNITISAEPTHPENPNGETVVTIIFKARDNQSGYNVAALKLRDPQGIDHSYWAYNDDTWSVFPTVDTTQWNTYTRTVVLPVGSVPGTWGMSEMTIYDRAGNFKGYDFTEVVHFELEK